MIKCVFLDMDGVVANFDKRYQELYGLTPKEAEAIGRHKFIEYFEDFITTKQFKTLELMPDAEELIRTLQELSVPTVVLSSTALAKRHLDIAEQKLYWLRNNNINFTPYLVPGRKLKKYYSAPGHALIDDHEHNIELWTNAGGIGILHKNTPETLAKLQETLYGSRKVA